MVRVVRIRELMTEGVVFLNGDMSTREAAEILVRHRIHGAPVLGKKGRIVGIVSLSDLLAPAAEDPPVKDVTTRLVYAVRADDPAIVAVRLMVSEDIHRALVVNDDATIAGIVAPMDILRALAGGLPLGSAPETEELDFFELPGATDDEDD